MRDQVRMVKCKSIHADLGLNLGLPQGMSHDMSVHDIAARRTLLVLCSGGTLWL